MATKLKEVDAVVVGMGWTGAILARELTKAGLQVVGLERGQDRLPGENFILPSVRDELRYSQRLELMMDNSSDTLTFRNRPDEQALPVRRIGAFLPVRASAAPASIGARCIGVFCRRIFASAARLPNATAQRRFR